MCLSRLKLLAAIAASFLAGMVPLAASAACAGGAMAALPPDARPQQIPLPLWQARVAQLDRDMAGTDLSQIQLVFLGDSITQGWYPLLFDQFYGLRRPLNLGVVGDTTRGALWRLGRLPLGSQLRPRLVVLLIGTNNLWPGVDPANVASGIAELVDQIRRRSPSSHVLLVGLLPRGAGADDPLRDKVREVNARIAGCADDMVTFADPGTMFLDGAGRLSPQIAYDYLHPTWLGYAILAAGLEPFVRRGMRE